MYPILPILFAGVVGFGHAFEIDHLVAVSSIVTRRNSIQKALKDGIYWGLGHTSTILLIGLLMLLARVAVPEQAFHFLEAAVGLMLVGLGIHRLYKTFWQSPFAKDPLARGSALSHSHPLARGSAPSHSHSDNHHLAYGVGLVHGLAGSGALVLAVMTELPSAGLGMLYLLIFGIGSIVGMLLASSIFSLPFSTRVASNPWLYRGLTLLSAALCIVLGTKIIITNLTL